MKHEELQELIKQQTRDAIKAHVNTSYVKESEDPLEEGIGATLGALYGTLAGAGAIAVGALQSLVLVNPIPFIGGLAIGMAVFKATEVFTKKMNDSIIRKAVTSLNKAIEERDKYFEEANRLEQANGSGEIYLAEHAKQIQRATDKIKKAAIKLRAVMKREEGAMSRLSITEQKQMEALLDAAEAGLVTNIRR